MNQSLSLNNPNEIIQQSREFVALSLYTLKQVNHLEMD